MSSKLFVTCVAAALTFLGLGFVGGRASKPEKVVTRLVPASRDSRAITDLPASEVVLAESGASRIAISEPVAPAILEPHEPTLEEALAALDRALRKRPIGDGSNAEFENKYRGVSLAAAREAMLLLNERFVKEQAAIIAQRMADGQVYERRADDGRGLEEHTFGRGGGTLSLAQEMGADGVMITRGTSFHLDEYPALHAVHLERDYLENMMRVPMPRGARSQR